jgi:hypothetical protein
MLYSTCRGSWTNIWASLFQPNPGFSCRPWHHHVPAWTFWRLPPISLNHFPAKECTSTRGKGLSPAARAVVDARLRLGCLNVNCNRLAPCHVTAFRNKITVDKLSGGFQSSCLLLLAKRTFHSRSTGRMVNPAWRLGSTYASATGTLMVGLN